MIDSLTHNGLEPGDVVGQRYVIQGPIGAGSMGEIFLALQRPFDRPTAIKMLAPAFCKNEEMIRRFHLEARVLSRLSHPNTVTVYDFGQHRDALFIAMEYIRGQNLADMIQTLGPLAVEDAVPLAIQVAQSLGEAHANGVIHRDLKPENILVSARSSGVPFAKVVDFGIAKLKRDDARSSRALLGTPHFMAPEQARGDEVDGRADLYALGCCLFEMLTGYPPFDGAIGMEVAYAQIHAPRPHLPSTFPVALDAFLQRALAVDPDARPSDAATFVAELVGAATSAAGDDRALAVSVARPGSGAVMQSEPGPHDPSIHERRTALSGETDALVPLDATTDLDEIPVVVDAPEPSGVRTVAILLAALVVLGVAAAIGLALLTPTATVEISSDPVGARVVVDGQSIGVTPLELEGDALSGTLELPGYAPAPFDARDREAVFVSLERSIVELVLEVPDNARGALLTVNGEPMGAVGSRRNLALEWPRNGVHIELADPRFEPVVERIPPAAVEPTLRVRIDPGRLVPRAVQ